MLFVLNHDSFFVHSHIENELAACLAACQETEQTVEFRLTDVHLTSRHVHIENMRPLAVTVADLGFCSRLKMAALVRACYLRYKWNDEIRSGRLVWNLSMTLKVYQTPEHCTFIYITMRTDFYSSNSNHCILCFSSHQVKSRNKALPGMCTFFFIVCPGALCVDTLASLKWMGRLR